MKILFIFALSIFIIPHHAHAQCQASDKSCMMNEILATSSSIDNRVWRDKILRELAKSYTHEGKEAQAIALIAKIDKPDTKAMAIRGIGMAAADNKWTDKERYEALFIALTEEAEKISHPPSQGIAYTYIAMAQAFAKDDKGAFETAAAMKNEALRNKAFGETAEIQAERGDYKNALQSIKQINNVAFKNKAYGLVSHIFTKNGDLQNAYAAAQNITNPYSKSQALQDIVNFGNKEETITDK